MKIKAIKEKVPTKNYVIVAVVSILVVILAIYISKFYLNYLENVKNTSVFYDKTIKQVNKDDLNYAFLEMSDAILYVSYTGNNEVYNSEKKLLKEIKKKDLTDKIVYFDVTSLLQNNEYLTILKDKYPAVSDELTSAPLFLYVKGGEAVEAMSSELKIVDSVVFNKLVEKYDIN